MQKYKKNADFVVVVVYFQIILSSSVLKASIMLVFLAVDNFSDASWNIKQGQA